MQVNFTENHFEIFGLTPGFDVDLEQLAVRYRELQRTVHPDRYASGSDQERRIAVQRTAQINQAYETLKRPLERARYLLQLHGVMLNDETDTKVDAAFLMDQMELRERLAEVREQGDPLAALHDLNQDIQRRTRAIIDALRDQLAPPSAENLARARDSVRKLQFMTKLQQEADQLDEELSDLA